MEKLSQAICPSFLTNPQKSEIAYCFRDLGNKEVRCCLYSYLQRFAFVWRYRQVLCLIVFFMSFDECSCGYHSRRRVDVKKRLHVRRDLSEFQLNILRLAGFKEVRDPGFSQGRGTAYLINNLTGESDSHYILWNLIYDLLERCSVKVEYHLTRFPDVVFLPGDGRSIAVEVEAGRKTHNELLRKLEILKRYDDWFFVVTKWENQQYYREYGPTFTRTWVKQAIAAYLGLETIPE